MYRRGSRGWRKHLDFILLDMCCLAVSFFLAYWKRHGYMNPMEQAIYREVFFAVLALDFVLMLSLNIMKDVLKRGYIKELKKTILLGCLLFLCSSTYLFATKISENYSRAALIWMILYYVLISYMIRILWKAILHRFILQRMDNALLLIVSASKSLELVERIQQYNLGHHLLVGIAVHDSDKLGETIKDIPVVADFQNIVEYVQKNWVDEVLISLDGDEYLPTEIMEGLIATGVTVHMSQDFLTKYVGIKQSVSTIGGIPVISSSMNYMSYGQYLVKRFMDICGGIAGCMITGILYLFLAPAIRKESPGPVFFTQERIGRNGKPFKIYKFRSMYLDAEERKAELLKQNRRNDNLMFKMDFDPRVIGNRIDEQGNQKTGIGEFIRKYSLDEFPQFYNVLIGEMSMVGTRPPLRSEYEAYSTHHKARLATTPGITGLWQVSGRSDILDFEDVVRLDTQYINEWSIGLDLKILLRTILVVLKKEGSM